MREAPITITEEIISDSSDISIIVDAKLDLDSGDITILKYWVADEDGNKDQEYNVKLQGLPAKHPNYDFSSGLLKLGTKELEFAVTVNKTTGIYEVNPHELEEIKEKSLKLISSEDRKINKNNRF